MDSERRSLYLYLLPVFGFFPTWWTLYRQPDQGSSSQKIRKNRANRT